MVDSIKIKSDDYYTCKTCEINSETKGRMCPCPRGSCEAIITGTIKTTTIIEFNSKLTKEQKKWNKNR